jgi:translation initiation factor 4A
MSNFEGSSEKITEFEAWDDADLKPGLLRSIFAHGFESPSPIQKRAVLPIVHGNDVIAQAQSGTGKTGAFVVGTIQSINVEKRTTQAMIMSPTRELSRQIHEVLTSLSTYVTGLTSMLLVGGTSAETDVSSLKSKSPHVIVGCPGRIHDMMRRQYINPKTLKLMVLDEADEMLSVGFKEQIYNIFQYLANDVQVALFSATLPPELRSLTDRFMRDPVSILVKSEALTLEGIAQHKVDVEDDQSKYNVLKDLYKTISMSQCIIYCNSVRRVMSLYDAMRADDYPVCCIHSSMERDQRQAAYNEFRTGKHRVLISSNVTARGIDIQQVSTVINFDIPKDVHTYLHRIGRSGRWGRKGLGINFASRRDWRKLKEIEEFYSTEITDLPASLVE